MVRRLAFNAIAVVAVTWMAATASGGAAATTGGTVKADSVLVFKSAHQMMLLREGSVIRSYRIALGRNPDGPKVAQGDGRTPEGRYILDWRNPGSRFYRSIHISYPGPDDRDRARRFRVSPGGDIMIHGLPRTLEAIGSLHTRWNWTEGCIAVTNAEMDEIWDLVDSGTPIEIRP